jgi:nucleoside-diphosphate-sugar epimerase
MTHLIFGAGQVGSHLAESLVADGQNVRVAKRSPAGIPEGADPILGDATDAEFCRRAAEGASVVYHCMNPPYDHKVWAEVLPRYLDNLVRAAGDAGARLVVLEPLYMIGREDTGPIDEETPFDPCSRKGEIRARMAERLLEAHRRGDVRAVSGRASDFYGPRGALTHFGERFWRAAIRGKTAEFVPNPESPHTYHFIPDVAAGLRALGAASDDAYGRSWMLPCAPAESSRRMIEHFADALGRPIRFRGVPRVAVKALGLFMPILREFDEMLYQWERPFVVDDTQFRRRFGNLATDPNEGARRTLEWAREKFA